MSVGRKNSTGVADTTNYNLGRGRAYIALLTSSGLPEEYRDVGNVPNLALNLDVEELEHFSSRAGLKTLDARVIVQQTIGGTITMDELSAQNFAQFLAATMDDTIANPAVAGIGEYLAMTSARASEGYWLDIRDPSTGLPARDIQAASVTLVHDKAGANDTLVLNTDYSVDEVNGMIFVLSTGVTIVDTKTLHVTLAADAGATATLDQVQALQASANTYALKFIGVNPLDSDKEMEWEFHKVRFSADGDLNLISDEFSQLGIAFAAEKNENWPDTSSQTVTLSNHAQ